MTMIVASTVPLSRFLAGAALALALAFACATTALAETGVGAKAIKIGGSMALSGPLGSIGNEFATGLNVVVDEVNAKGGIHGRKIEFVQMDDGYDAKRTLENSKKMAEEGVFAFVGTLGTANILAAMPVVEQNRIPLFGAFSGADSIRALKQELMFTTIAAYGDESEKMVQQGWTLNVQSYAVAYLDNAFGKDGLAGVERALQKRQSAPVIVAAVKTDASNAEEAAKTIAASPAQAVLVMTAGKATLEFVRHIRRLSPSKQVMLLSVADTNLIVRELDKAAAGIVVAQTVPSPIQSKLKISREYQDAMKRAGKEEQVSYASMTGYMTARAFVEILRRAGPSLTRERFLQVAHGSGPIELGGYLLDYGNGRQHGASYVELTMIGSGGKGFKY
ncbi:ABC transporter substrate-binding protein [Ramlibacter albus]|uniref:ABC transporter substrate-binding protein n=1 Tax=Ramlibacter albus TaxID=2079448 RepID=A0A923M2D2_9BURK|nr:ABC transporter substrate-binding protein [Ramlibacter albus]MBC5762852.1 ABC transporter substrate-binding protein [Ramlibacter albus]